MGLVGWMNAGARGEVVFRKSHRLSENALQSSQIRLSPVTGLRNSSCCQLADGSIAMLAVMSAFFRAVILSGGGAQATTESKDPENAGCDDADTGNSPETVALRNVFAACQQHGRSANCEELGILPLSLTTCVARFGQDDSVESDVLAQDSLSKNVKTLTGVVLRQWLPKTAAGLPFFCHSSRPAIPA